MRRPLFWTVVIAALLLLALGGYVVRSARALVRPAGRWAFVHA